MQGLHLGTFFSNYSGSSAYPSVHPSVRPSIHPFIHLSIHLPAHSRLTWRRLGVLAIGRGLRHKDTDLELKDLTV